MSFNNYRKEEEVTDTTETGLDNYKANRKQMQVGVQDTAEKLNRNYDILNWIESQVPEDAQAFVQESKAITQQMAERITLYDQIHAQTEAFVGEMAKRMDQVAGDYEELQNDIADMNTDNPLIERLVEDVEQSTYEWIAESEGCHGDALEEAIEQVFTEMHEHVRQSVGTDDTVAVHNFSKLVSGMAEMTDEQRDLFKQLLATCSAPGDHNGNR